MQCRYAQELFSEYIAQSLDSALTVTLENHLATCAACREEAEGLRLVWDEMDRLPLQEPPAFFHENIMSRIDAAQAEAEAAVAQKRAMWDWRALFRPRSLAFGAMALILMLACVEAVQTERAEIGPIGYLVRLLHPAPAPTVHLAAPRADLFLKDDGSAEAVDLVLRVDRVPAADAAVGGVDCRATIEGSADVFQARVSADRITILRLPFTRDDARVTVTLSPIGSPPVTQTIFGPSRPNAPADSQAPSSPATP